MKTPEEIKKGLECCMFDSEGLRNCDECPYVDDGSIYEMLNKDALAYIQQLEAARPKWISVEERLPEQDTCVLAAFLYYDGYRIRTARYSVSGEEPIWLIGDMCAIGSTPTHWMPLPVPPDEAQKDTAKTAATGNGRAFGGGESR